ncbi:MAG: mannose-1-phosphate guanylyltransferase [Lachnospiraceae bacterium]|nr:mannose-1-phosphate guanylyltransferase [Lachnospiraceae bacterium]
MKVYGVIMAGGGGTRLWPLSRKKLPKQFLNLTGKDTLVNETFDRLVRVVAKEDIFVVTNQIYGEKTLEIMGDRIKPDHVLLEPQARNTAACIGYAAMEILEKYGDGVMCVMSADPYIKDEALYAETVKRGVELAAEQDCLVTIGIKPEYPATGYGYIKGQVVKNVTGAEADHYLVEEFVEKPALELAIQYLEAGCYVWNSGMFIWKASVILDYFKRLLPDIYEKLLLIGEAMGTREERKVIEETYPLIPKISIDYGIMERADKVLMLQGEFGWCDIGNLDSLEVLHEKDDKGNAGVGKCVFIDTSDTICYAKNKLVTTVGVENLIVVETDDTLIVCAKDAAQTVKEAVAYLEENGLEEYL